MKEKKKNQVLDQKMQMSTMDEIARTTLDTMENTSSSKSDDESEVEDQSMMA